MPNIHTHVRLVAAAAILTIAGVACGAAKPSPTPRHATTPTPTPKPAPTATPAPPPPPLAAPWVFQVENLNDARPQAGLNAADIVYEYETEGGISRFSAMFFENPRVAIGPVRSARLATVKLTQIYNGTLVYSGASGFVYQTIADNHLRSYNESSAQGALFRINNRFAPHNLYTDGPHMAQLAQLLGPQSTTYQLWWRTPVTSLPPGGVPLPKFSVPVSDSENPIYTYDPATGGYQRTEPDTGVLVDSNTQQPWEPKTIVLLAVAVTIGPEVEDVSGTHGLDFGIVATGGAQVMVGGQIYQCTFTQGASGPPQLTLANGSPAPIGFGQVLIELVKPGRATVPR